MARQHGIDADTYRRFIIDAGAVYKNYGLDSQALLGATRGGNKFAVETEYREMEVDGAKGPVKGGRRITKVVPTIVANFIEITPEILLRALPGSSSADYPTLNPTHKQITRSLQIALSDYCTNIAIVGEVSGSAQPVVIILSNVLGDGNLEVSMQDNDEAALAVTFKGHFDPDALDTEPWEIRFPDIPDTTTTTAGA